MQTYCLSCRKRTGNIDSKKINQSEMDQDVLIACLMNQDF